MLARTGRSRPTITATEPVRRRVVLADVGATRALGSRLSTLLRPGDVVALEGDLGAGKSELARAVIHSRAGARIEVPSPTFTLLQPYDLPGLPLVHADLYRLGDDQELAELGLDDALDTSALLIEWAERAGAALPSDRLTIRLQVDERDPDARQVEIVAGPSWLERLAEILP